MWPFRLRPESDRMDCALLRSFKTRGRAACSGLRCRDFKSKENRLMRAIYTIALLPVITVVCWGQEEGAPKNELAFGLGGLPSLSRSDALSLNAGPGTGLQVNYGRRFL